MDRLIYGTRLKGRWAYVAGDRSELFRNEGAVVTTAGACCWCGAALLLLERVRREEAYLTILDPRSDDAEWRLRCEACGQGHLIAQMPARQCAPGGGPAVGDGWVRADCKKRRRCDRCGHWPQWGWWRDGEVICNACHGDPPDALTRYDARPPAWAVDLDERDANARYGLGG